MKFWPPINEWEHPSIGAMFDEDLLMEVAERRHRACQELDSVTLPRPRFEAMKLRLGVKLEPSDAEAGECDSFVVMTSVGYVKVSVDPE